jgi:hypothetical protein
LDSTVPDENSLKRAKLEVRLRAALAYAKAKPAEFVVGAVMAISIALGLLFRARGYLYEPSALWLDESIWAMNLTDRSLVRNMIRPPGFILFSRGLVEVFGPTETVLRGLPWLAGVATTIGSPWLARKLYTSPAARVLFVAVVALNPTAIDFSKEFKPYAIGLALHLSLVLLALRYVEKRRALDLGWALGTALVGSVFAQDLVFAFPGLFLVLGYEALKHRRQHLPAVFGVAGIIIVIILLQYFFLWRHLGDDSAEYWGNKYDVFFTSNRKGGYLAWSFNQYRDMTGLPGIRREFWQNGGMSFDTRQQIRTVDRVIWLAIHLMGLMIIVWRKRWREGLLLVLPLALLWIFNAFGQWPMGAFRTNVFTLGYLTAIAAMAFDAPTVSSSTRWLWTLPALALVFLPIAWFERNWHVRKQAFTYDSKMPKLMERLVELRQSRSKAPLLLDRRSCKPWQFYTRYHPDTSKRLTPLLEKSYDFYCVPHDSKIPEMLLAHATAKQAVWIVLHVGHGLDGMLKQGRLYPLGRVSRFEIGPHTVMSFRRRDRPPAQRPPDDATSTP